MKASPILHGLNGGEFSPLMAGRSDIAKYPASLKLCQNFITLVQGPAVRRGGTQYVASKKGMTTRGWIVRFEFSATQAWILEFGDGYVRFYSNHGQVVVSGVAAWSHIPTYTLGALVAHAGVNYYCIASNNNEPPPNAAFWYPLAGDIYEIPSPYALADLTNDDGTCALNCEQSGDVIYIANKKRTHVPRKLTRHGATDWRFTTYNPNTGPFLEQNDGAITLYASGNTGSVTLNASAALFSALDVGRLVRLQVQDLDVEPWETNKSYSTNDLVRYDGKTYKCLGNDTSGTSPPIHEHGTAYDGKGGVQWAYQDPGYAVFRITAFGTATSVTATVIADEANGLNLVPAALVGSGTPSKRWALGAWSNSTEWPATVAFWHDRLWWAGRQRYWGTVPLDFENMAGDFFGQTRADNAIWRILQATDVNDIVFLEDAGDLVIGTPGGEFVASKITDSQPLGPANIMHKRQSKYRCRSTRPKMIGNRLCYVQRAGRKLLSLGFNFDVDRYLSDDLAIFADRMPRAGIVDMAYQSEPFSVLWCVLADGQLIAITINDRHEVSGWHRHPIGGKNVAVEGIACIPAPDGTHDELWLLVRRTVGVETVRYIEFMRRPWEGIDNDGNGGDDPHDAFYIDSGLTFRGNPATVFIEDVDVLNFPAIGMRVTVKTTTPHRLLVGQTITISGVIATGAYNINGEARVVQILSATQFRIETKAKAPFGEYSSGGEFISLAPLSTTISGLGHLKGETVSVLCDAATHPDRIVDLNGEIVVNGSPSVVHVGLRCPARIITSDIEAGGPAGTSQGKLARIYKCGVRFIDSLGGQIGKPEKDDIRKPSTLDDIDYRVPSDPMDRGLPFRSTVIDVTFPGDWEREKCIEIYQDQPLPITVANIMPRLHVNDR